MRLSKVFIALGITAIPVWYVYRTLHEGRTRRLEWNEVFLTEEVRRQKAAEDAQTKAQAKADENRRQAEAKQQEVEAAAAKGIEERAKAKRERDAATQLQACVTNVGEAESSYQAYMTERARYWKYTQNLLQSNLIALTSRGDSDRFTEVFRRLYVHLDPEKTVRDHHEHIEAVAKDCAELGTAISSLSPQIRAADFEHEFFERATQHLARSRSDMRAALTYISGSFPDTLQGQLERDRAVALLYQ